MTKSELVERSAAQRAVIVAAAEPLVRVAASADRVVSIFLGSRRLFDLATRAVTLYALFRK